MFNIFRRRTETRSVGIDALLALGIPVTVRLIDIHRLGSKDGL